MLRGLRREKKMKLFTMVRTLALMGVPMLTVSAGSVILGSGSAYAQTTGTIKGEVIDDAGMEVPGVLMTVDGPNLIGGAQQEYTDDTGRFLFTNLPPGLYTVTAEKAGFGKKRYANQQVLIGKNTILTIEMSVQEAGADMDVIAERPAIDTESASRTTVLTKEFLERVPNSRSYQDAVGATAGVLAGGNPNMGGASYNENTYMMDGVNVTDPVTGTFSLNFNYDAMEQLEVITGAFDAEYASNLGGIINLVTRTGSNQLEFDTSVYYETAAWAPKMDARFAADGADLAPTDFDSQFSSMSFNGLISGPVVRDKAFLVVSYSMTRSLIARVGIDLPRDYENHNLYAKLTMQPTAANRFTVLSHIQPTTIDNTTQNNRFVNPDAQSRQAQGGILASAQWDWFPATDVTVESKLTVQQNYIEQGGVPCTHNKRLGYNPCEPDELENTYDYTTPGRLGINNAYNSGNFYYFDFDDRTRWRAESKVSALDQQIPFLIGDHDFKAGFEADFLSWNRTVGYTNNIVYYDWNRQPYDPSSFQNYYWVEASGEADIVAGGEHYGAFIQDVYQPIDNLTFRYGLRWDRSIMRNNFNEPVINFGVFGPRFYVIWDPFGDGKTKVSGGYGRFNGIGNLGIAADLNQSNGLGSKLFLGEAFNNYTNGTSFNYSLNPPDNTNSVHDTLTAPHSDEFSFVGERQVIQDVVFGLSFTSKFTRNVYVFDETNVIWDEKGYGFIGTGDGQVENRNRLRTPSLSRRDYYQTDTYLRKNFADRWLGQATYSYVVSRGTVLEGNSTALAVAPQAELAYGNLGTDVRHQVKAQLAWDLPNDPWTTRLGASLEYYSGGPASRYYFSAGYGGNALLREPYGTYARFEPTYYANLSISQAIKVPKGQFRVEAALLNAINARQSETVSGTYLYAQNRWSIVYRQNLMSGRIGVSYDF